MAVAFLLVVLVVVSMLTINMVEYTDENGESSTGIAAARELRAEKNAHAGYITSQRKKRGQYTTRGYPIWRMCWTQARRRSMQTRENI